MGLDPFLTSTSGQGLHVPPPLRSISWEADQRRKANTNKPHSRRAAGPFLLCTVRRSVETPCPCGNRRQKEGWQSQVYLIPGCPQAPREDLFPWQLRPDQDCNGVYPDLGTGLETHKLIHLRSQHDTSQGSPTQTPLGFSK